MLPSIVKKQLQIEESKKSTGLKTFIQKTHKISDFVLMDVIGIGCFAKVQLAKWVSSDNKACVLKIINKNVALRFRQVHNLIREHKLLSYTKNPFLPN